jgi:hypothetical protein
LNPPAPRNGIDPPRRHRRENSNVRYQYLRFSFGGTHCLVDEGEIGSVAINHSHDFYAFGERLDGYNLRPESQEYLDPVAEIRADVEAQIVGLDELRIESKAPVVISRPSSQLRRLDLFIQERN